MKKCKASVKKEHNPEGGKEILGGDVGPMWTTPTPLFTRCCRIRTSTVFYGAKYETKYKTEGGLGVHLLGP